MPANRPWSVSDKAFPIVGIDASPAHLGASARVFFQAERLAILQHGLQADVQPDLVGVPSVGGPFAHQADDAKWIVRPRRSGLIITGRAAPARRNDLEPNQPCVRVAPRLSPSPNRPQVKRAPLGL